jgi:hypothetical protein
MESVAPIAYPKGLVDFFDQQVLAPYRNEPQKYQITSDNFEGTLTVTDEYYGQLDAAGKTKEYISIRFGYRTLSDGNLAVAVWLPDLLEKSRHHAPRWAAFHLKNEDWTTERDERFENWIRRNIEGSFDVDNGPLFYLGETIQIVNGLTSELVGIPLYKHELDHKQISYPAGENTYRYEDAHKTLYGYLVDGLDKNCISALSNKLGRTLKIGSKKTVEALTMLFPALQNEPHFMPSISLVSDQRRLASHSARPPAKSFPAFSTFTNDLYRCLNGVKEVLAIIEKEFGVDGRGAFERHEAKKLLPRIVHPPQPNYSIVQASGMKGKTIEKVAVGTRDDIKEVHGSEAIIIYFTDGSIMGLDTGSNAWNVATSEKPFHAEDLHVDFRVQWVPPLPKKP